MAVADAASASGQSSSIDRASAKSPHDQRNSFRDEEFGTEDQISPAKSARENSQGNQDLPNCLAVVCEYTRCDKECEGACGLRVLHDR